MAEGDNPKKVTIHTDGACDGNPGPGGWAAVLRFDPSRYCRVSYWMFGLESDSKVQTLLICLFILLLSVTSRGLATPVLCPYNAVMFCRRLLVLLLLIANASSGAIKRPERNGLLVNGGFEQGLTGWSFLLSGANAAGEIDSTTKHGGHCAFKMTNKSAFGPNVYARIVQVLTDLEPFAKYRVSCWVKGQDCGINWIGGGPGWLTRTPFPKGDFDWQLVSFEINAGAAPENYELMVLSESPTAALWVDDISVELTHVDQTKQEGLYGPLDAQIDTLKQRLSVLKRQSPRSPNSYIDLGTAVAERFIRFAEEGWPGRPVGISWTRLQLEEVAEVLSETERLASNASPVLNWSRPRLGTVTLKGGIFYQSRRPVYFAGYGHFDSVIRDLADFPQLGATLVQDGRAGPSSMNKDGALGPNAVNVLTGVDKAARFGMRTDFLLSPHYYPDWGGAPDLHNGNIGFLGFNIFHPRAKEVVGNWSRAMARQLKDKPGLLSVCLANEPVYNCSGRDPYTRPEFTQYLRRQHGQIASLNALYGTHYATFEEVPVPPDAMPSAREAQRAYYDWTVFNKQMFAGWHGWLVSQLKSEGLKAPTHTKIMVFQTLDRDKLGHGVDPELMCRTTDLAGCDAYAFLSGVNTYDWLGQEFCYDLLHSFCGQPVFNSENHLIPDGSPASHIPMNHTRAVVWQGGLHHQGATTIWVWEQAADPSLAGSIYFRPANIFGAGRAMDDLNRLAQEVTAINAQKASVALLYSPTSVFWEPKYKPTLLALYTALNLLGQQITFVSERQLAEGKAAKVQRLVVPNATHVLPTTPGALNSFRKSGGKILLVGKESLKRDQYDRALETRAFEYSLVELADQDKATAAMLARQLALPVQELRDKVAGEQAWGIEYRIVSYKGSTLVPLINFNKESKKVQFPAWRNKEARDLLTGERVDLDNIELPPMLPRLLQVKG